MATEDEDGPRRASSSHHRGVPLAPNTPTLDAMWSAYGPHARALVSRACDEAHLDAVCLEVLKRAALSLARSYNPATGHPWPAFRRAAIEVCEELARGTVDAASLPVPHGALPEALPFHIRAHFLLRVRQARRDAELLAELGVPAPTDRLARFRLLVRAALERSRRGMSVVVGGAFLARWRERRLTRLHEAVRRVDGALLPSAVDVSAQAGVWFAAHPVLSQVAAVVTTIVALGLGGQASPVRVETATWQQPAPAGSGEKPVSVATLAADRHPDTRPLPVGESPPVPPELAQAPAQPPIVTGPAAPGPPDPEVRTTAPAAVQEPVRRDPEGGGLETAPASLSVDADNNDEEEVDRPAPVVFLECPEEGERGPVTSIKCAVIEELPE